MASGMDGKIYVVHYIHLWPWCIGRYIFKSLRFLL